MSINNFDWQKIETFDQKVEWQKSLAIYVHDLSRFFAIRLGEEHEKKTEPDIIRNNYNDDIVQISCITQICDHGRKAISTYIYLVALDSRVFSVTFIGRGDQPYYNIDGFRVGSWLNHIESLRLKLELIDKAEEEKRNRNRERHFRRLD